MKKYFNLKDDEFPDIPASDDVNIQGDENDLALE